jgi:hypothetical protein
MMLTKSLSLLLFFCLAVNAVARQAPSDGAGKLAGMTSDPLNVYVPNAHIIIKGGRLKKEIWSGNDGTYSVDLPPGIYSVRVVHPGFLPVRKRVRVTRGTLTKLDVVFHLNTKGSVTVY